MQEDNQTPNQTPEGPEAAPEASTGNTVPSEPVASPEASPEPVETQPTVEPAPETMNSPAPTTTPTAASPTTPLNQPANSSAKSKRKALSVMIAGAVVLLLALGAVLYFLVFNNKISAKDVSNAKAEASALNSDVSDISSNLSSNNGPTTVSGVEAQISGDKNKLADAEKQYALLSKSKVLKDGKTDTSFKALQNKWGAFDTYASEDLKDSQAIFPPLLQYTNSLNKITQTSPSTPAQLSSFLTSFKNTTDQTSASLKGVKAILPENQQGLTALEGFLTTSSEDIAAAQKALAAGDYTGVENDMTKIQTSENSFNAAMTKVNTQSDNHAKQVDPSTQISNFQTALDNLQTQLGYK